MVEHPPDFGLETAAVPAAIGLGVGLQETREAVFPIGIESGGDDRGVVGPVLEQIGAVLQQAAKLGRTIGLVAGEQDHVVGALDHLDAVELDEAQALDQRQQAVHVKPSARRRRQTGQIQRQATGGRRRDNQSC